VAEQHGAPMSGDCCWTAAAGAPTSASGGFAIMTLVARLGGAARRQVPGCCSSACRAPRGPIRTDLVGDIAERAGFPSAGPHRMPPLA
jgi:hypothetical protein